MSAERATERTRVGDIRDRFVHSLREAGVAFEINGHWGERRHPGNVNLRFWGQSGADILSAAQSRLAASTGAACASGLTEPSHVLRAIGLTAEEAGASIRFSFGRFNSPEDSENAARIVAASVGAVEK